MNLALFGATGLSGAAVLAEALARGHHVTVLARKPSAIPPHAHLTVRAGDALVEADVAACLEGSAAVIHCVGVGGKGDGKPTTLCSRAIDVVVPAMQRHRVSRLIAMSNYWAGGSGAWAMRRLVLPVAARWLIPILEDKDRMEAVLAACDLDWTAPRFPAIVDGPAKPVRTSLTGRGTGMKITTGSVAAFMLDLVDDRRFLRATPAASN